MLTRRSLFSTLAKAPIALPILATAALSEPDEQVVPVGKGYIGDHRYILNGSKKPIRVLPDQGVMFIITG
jgi:hypothetical protein